MSNVPDSADLNLSSHPYHSDTEEPVETIPDSAPPPGPPPIKTAADELARIIIDADAKLSLLCPHCKRTGTGPMGEGGPEWDKEADVRKVIPVAPGSKYVILVPTDTATEILFKLQDILRDWWEDDNQPFVIIGDQFQFVKVDDVEVPPLASCGYVKCPGHKPESHEVCDELGDQVEMVT